MPLPINDALTISAPRSANSIIPQAEFVESLSTRAPEGATSLWFNHYRAGIGVLSTVLPKAEVNLAHPAADPLRSSSL